MRWWSINSPGPELSSWSMLLVAVALLPSPAAADPGITELRPAVPPTALHAGPLRLRTIFDALSGRFVADVDVDDQRHPDAIDGMDLQLNSIVADNTPGFRFSLRSDSPDVFLSWQFEF